MASDGSLSPIRFSARMRTWYEAAGLRALSVALACDPDTVILIGVAGHGSEERRGEARTLLLSSAFISMNIYIYIY